MAPSQAFVPNVWSRFALIVVCSLGCDRDERDSTPPQMCNDTVARAASDYIPADARGIVSLQVDEVVDWEREVVGDSVVEHSTYGTVLDAMAACGLGHDSIRTFTVAAGSGEDEVIGVLEGDGIGDEDRLRCLESELGSRSILHDWGIERHGCDVRIVEEGETVGFVAGPDTLVVATPSWLRHARAVSLGARPTPPRKLVRKIQDRRTMWFGGDLVEYQDELGSLPLVGGLETVVGYVDLDSGFELEVEGTYDSREAASAVASELEALRRRGRLLAPELGIPPRLFDRVGVKQRGREVELTIDLSKADVRRITDALSSRA